MDTWVSSALLETLFRFAIKGGHNVDGTPYYVGRCGHMGYVLPARVITPKEGAVSWRGQDYLKNNCELLVGPGYGWASSQNGQVPPSTVASGQNKDGEVFYIGRAVYGGRLIMGEIKDDHQGLSIAFDGQDLKLRDYEVLTRAQSDTWLPTELGSIPSGAVIAGYDSDGTIIYVARAVHNGIKLPAKFLPEKGVAFVASDGKEILKTDIEVLVGANYTWLELINDEVPPNAVFTDRSRVGAPLCVARVRLRGEVIPGLMVFEGKYATVAYRGRGLNIINYEVLVRQ